MTDATFTATHVRQNFFDLLDQVSNGQLTFTISRKGKADVVVSKAKSNSDSQYLKLLRKSQGIITAQEADKVLKIRTESNIPRSGTTW